MLLFIYFDLIPSRYAALVASFTPAVLFLGATPGTEAVRTFEIVSYEYGVNYQFHPFFLISFYLYCFWCHFTLLHLPSFSLSLPPLSFFLLSTHSCSPFLVRFLILKGAWVRVEATFLGVAVYLLIDNCFLPFRTDRALRFGFLSCIEETRVVFSEVH